MRLLFCVGLRSQGKADSLWAANFIKDDHRHRYMPQVSSDVTFMFMVKLKSEDDLLLY